MVVFSSYKILGAATLVSAAIFLGLPKPATAFENASETYRAALIVQAPREPSKVKTYPGTVIWRLDDSPGESGKVIHADIDIPEDKLKASVTLQKNGDANVFASHTIIIVFKVQSSAPTGTVKQINIPEIAQFR